MIKYRTIMAIAMGQLTKVFESRWIVNVDTSFHLGYFLIVIPSVKYLTIA